MRGCRLPRRENTWASRVGTTGGWRGLRFGTALPCARLQSCAAQSGRTRVASGPIHPCPLLAAPTCGVHIESGAAAWTAGGMPAVKVRLPGQRQRHGRVERGRRCVAGAVVAQAMRRRRGAACKICTRVAGMSREVPAGRQARETRASRQRQTRLPPPPPQARGASCRPPEAWVEVVAFPTLNWRERRELGRRRGLFAFASTVLGWRPWPSRQRQIYIACVRSCVESGGGRLLGAHQSSMSRAGPVVLSSPTPPLLPIPRSPAPARELLVL